MSVTDCVDRWAGRACGFRAGRAELINGVSLIAVRRLAWEANQARRALDVGIAPVAG